nr:formin-like protein 20 [Equus asinus]
MAGAATPPPPPPLWFRPPAGSPGPRGGAALQQPDCLRRAWDSSDIGAPPPSAGAPANHGGPVPPPPPRQPIAAPARPRPDLPAQTEFPGLPGEVAACGRRVPRKEEAVGRTRCLCPLGDAARSQPPPGVPRRGRLSVGLQFTTIQRLQAAACLQKLQKRLSGGEERFGFQPWILGKLFISLKFSVLNSKMETTIATPPPPPALLRGSAKFLKAFE